MAPIKYQKICSSCGKEVSPEQIVRGYEYQKGNYVVINEGDFERIPQENTKTIDILDFVKLEQVDPVYFDKTYYLEPAPGGEKAYTLIVEAMEKTKKIGIAKVLIRSKQALAALRVKDKVLVMETIFYPDEIHSPASLNHGLDSGKLHENEIKMAVSLIENLSTDFDPARYHDDYRQALWEVIEARIAGQEIAIPVQNAAKGNVIDLMDALKASVKLAEDNRKKENKKVGSACKKAKATGT
jgi:DNA end-binding protein Ku